MTNLNLSFFSNLLLKKMSSIETYGDFRVKFLYDESGENLWGNNLFLNIHDVWCIFCNGFLLKDYRTKNSLLKRIIRKKIRGNKELPTYNFASNVCKEGGTV